MELLPYQVLSYDDLPNEIWEALPGFDDYFYISNFGRLKSIDRELLSTKGYVRFYKGRIYKPTVAKYYNHTTKDFALELKVGISYLGKNYKIMIARKVYELFIETIAADKLHWFIGFKDGNNLNVCVDNLELLSPQEKMHRAFHNNRCTPIYTFKTPASYIKMAMTKHKPVTQFKLNGKPIKIFNSIKEAAIQTNLDSSAIVAACKQKAIVSCGGFLWQYGIIKETIKINYYADFLRRSGNKNQYINNAFSLTKLD